MLEFCDGYAKTEYWKDAYPLVRTYKCLLKAGYTVEPEIYSDKIQVFSFYKWYWLHMRKEETITLMNSAFYIPDFDREKFSFMGSRRYGDYTVGC